LGVLNLSPDLFNIVEFILDFLLTWLGDGDLEHVGSPLRWDIGDLDVFLHGGIEFFDLLLECLSFSRFLESFTSSFDGTSLFVAEGIMEGLFVGLVPSGSLEGIEGGCDIGKLVREVHQVLVVNVDCVLSVVEDVHIFEGLANVFPLLNEFLALFGFEELVVEFSNGCDLLGFAPSLQ